jgi:hypothetical protein
VATLGTYLYPAALDGFPKGLLDALDGTLTFQALTATGVYDPAHVLVSEVAGPIGTPWVLEDVTYEVEPFTVAVTRVRVAASPAFVAGPVNTPIEAGVIYSGATSRLIAYLGLEADYSAPRRTTDRTGGGVVWSFPRGLFTI